MRKLALPLLAALALGACHAVRPAELAAPDYHPAWSRNAVIYEVNIRQYTPEGTFAALEKHLPRLKALGVDVLWLMPVQPIGKAHRKGVLGSYYSVGDYQGVNPEYGTLADFEALVRSAHALGMKVILDWVPNHTSYDHPWITQHPDWYMHRADGSIDWPKDQQGKETDWTDVAKLDYSKPAMRAAMIDAMKWWLDRTGIDGFRCDVAWGPPYDFWTEARRALEADHPGLFMLAEAEDPKLHPSFDMTYGWELFHLLNAIAAGKQGTGALDRYLARDDSLYPRSAYRMYFTSNHDENSWSGTEFERMGPNYANAYVLAATLEQSMPLLYTGQEAALNRRLRFFEKDTISWSETSLAAFYHSVFTLKHDEPALWNGQYGGPEVKLGTNGGDRVYAFTRTRGSNTVLVAVNFGDAATSVSYASLPHPGRYTDWFSRSAVQLPATGKLDIPAHGFRVLVR